jgi:hypothetical protein
VSIWEEVTAQIIVGIVMTDLIRGCNLLVLLPGFECFFAAINIVLALEWIIAASFHLALPDLLPESDLFFTNLENY